MRFYVCVPKYIVDIARRILIYFSHQMLTTIKQDAQQPISSNKHKKLKTKQATIMGVLL